MTLDEKEIINNFKVNLSKKDKSIAIVGLGYVGLPLAVQFASTSRCLKTDKRLNRKIYGFDINSERINSLKKGVDKTKEISKKEVKDAYEIRSLIELRALDLFFDEMSKKEIGLIIKKTKRLISTKKRKKHSEIDIFKERIDLDHHLHRYIVSKMDNKIISEFHRNTESISLLARISLPPHYHIQGQAMFEHLEILNAILNNNKSVAKKALTSHLRQAANRAMSSIKE